jgi:hypothetical protein
MLNSSNRSVHSALYLLLALLGFGLESQAGELLVRFDRDFAISAVGTSDATIAVRDQVLEVVTGHTNPWPGITLRAPRGRWDLSAFERVSIDVKNAGREPADVALRVDNPGADGVSDCLTGQIHLQPAEQKTLSVLLARKMPAGLRDKLFGMRGLPGGWSEKGGIDPANVDKLLVFVPRPKADHRVEISKIRAEGTYHDSAPDDAAKLFPLIDAFGQYIHKDWPGKIHTAADFAARKKAEAEDLAGHAGPDDWDQYGGWKSGPQLATSGRFRVEKREGKWWLVDPEGHLFWSHGIDCVRAENSTPTTDREDWFAALPAKSGELGRFYGRGNWAPHGYYQGKSYETFNFTGANLRRKYGDDWNRASAGEVHVRLRSWGMNTIGNWSDASIISLRKTPYVATVHVGGRVIESSEGYWGKFSDPFDASFARSAREGMAAERRRAVGDPWCLGYFLGNELSWGNETSLASAALTSPAEQPAKKAFLADLKTKYREIERLNAAWGTRHSSWASLAESRMVPDPKKSHDDLAVFYTRTAEQFFRICREAVKEADPQALYLGCRFAWANDLAVRAASKYCDVVSFNRYQRSVADLSLPSGVDRPVIIGEFHFGALDRGMFHTGLVPTASQQERAAAYRDYVRSALKNPLMVGTHWFQYGDQATTGRGDGENYQIGFVDICDTPYPETIQACREVGYNMYDYRARK